jgi:hypothetical protein
LDLCFLKVLVLRILVGKLCQGPMRLLEPERAPKYLRSLLRKTNLRLTKNYFCLWT